ncbi:MAG: LPS-assembly protein LptD [Muribaculaceae bacterium]|nr:LPS-assembly protein LptD [Muribaculaceae bacterium]
MLALCALSVFGTPDNPAEDTIERLSVSMPLPDSAATDAITANDSVRHFIAPVDSAVSSHGDSILTDSLLADTTIVAPDFSRGPIRPTTPLKSRMRYDRVDLDAAVVFSSSDSMIIMRRDSAYMYGNGSVTYGDIKLNAAEIQMDLNDNTVYAVGRPDSLGEITGKPVFSEKGTDYEAATMRYNFKTERGFITNVVTQQGEGYLTGGTTKKTEENEFYIKDGRYTTCDHHDNPHFYFQLTKAKVHPGKNIVVGPAYMVLAGLPLPLAVPFGFFPFTDKYASGIIVPSFGEDYNRGFYLREGGYYFALSDHIDLALTGELYTKGSWGINARSTYAKRYKFSGSFNIGYLKTITGEKGSPDHASQTNFQVVWNHSQDSKSNPNMSLSASVNFSTSGYSRNDLNSYYSPSFTENTKSSTVNMTYRFPGTKWSLSTTVNIAQRTQDSTLTVSFPNVTVTMSQIYPFKRKKAVGAERWYEKIKMSYTGILQNSLTSKQNVFFKKSLIKDWRNGMSHKIPISATFNVLKYINVTPSLNFADRMYTSKVSRSWDAERGVEQMDTTYSFYNVWDFQASVSMDTKVYAFFQPLGALGKKIKMIRYVMTPSLSFNGAPDFSSPFFGYYGQYSYVDNRGAEQVRKYNYFPSALFGTPSQGRNGSISLSLANNLEMKVKSANDSIGERKISLIENFTLSESYNIAADSLRWSDLNTSILLRLTKSFNLNLSATWDVYTYGLNASGTPVKINKLRIASGKGIGRLMRTGTSFSYTFNNSTFKRKSKNNDQNSGNNENDNGAQANQRRVDTMSDYDHGDIEMTSEGYAKWTVPWSLTLNYSVNYGYGAFNKQKMEFDGKITQNLSISGNIRPTPGWNLSMSASYNFDTKKLAYMNCNISRDLHCFTMTASFVPVGPYKSYNFHIAVNSSLLKDLKYDKRSSMSNGIQWY